MYEIAAPEIYANGKGMVNKISNNELIQKHFFNGRQGRTTKCNEILLKYG